MWVSLKTYILFIEGLINFQKNSSKNICEKQRIIHSLFFSNLDKVAAFVAVGVLGGEGECRAGEVQFAFAALSSLRYIRFFKH